MTTIILAGSYDHSPRLAMCHSAESLRRVLSEWVGSCVPDLDFDTADPATIEESIYDRIAPTDWSCLECFPLTDDGQAFTGEMLSFAAALSRFEEEAA